MFTEQSDVANRFNIIRVAIICCFRKLSKLVSNQLHTVRDDRSSLSSFSLDLEHDCELHGRDCKHAACHTRWSDRSRMILVFDVSDFRHQWQLLQVGRGMRLGVTAVRLQSLR